jgi:cell filamentation protein
MDRAEFEALVVAQEVYVERVGPDTLFTAATIRDMHRTWLSSIYTWAGQYRTVELQKGAFRWPPAYLVERNMQGFESGVLRQNTPCAPGTVEEVAGRLAVVHAELLLIHPFRDGNGRVARWFSDLMALQAGLPAPAYAFEGRGQAKRRQAYLAAVTRGYVQDYAPLTAFFKDALGAALEVRA